MMFNAIDLVMVVIVIGVQFYWKRLFLVREFVYEIIAVDNDNDN